MADKITAKELAPKKDGFVMIDVRERDEVKTNGAIEGSQNIPLGELIRSARQGKLDDLKGNDIVNYCNCGYRGNIGADELVKKGFKATTIDGGYDSWREEKRRTSYDVCFIISDYQKIKT
jgi:rhodanese-related sulfurtransferase